MYRDDTIRGERSRRSARIQKSLLLGKRVEIGSIQLPDLISFGLFITIAIIIAAYIATGFIRRLSQGNIAWALIAAILADAAFIVAAACRLLQRLSIEYKRPNVIVHSRFFREKRYEFSTSDIAEVGAGVMGIRIMFRDGHILRFATFLPADDAAVAVDALVALSKVP